MTSIATVIIDEHAPLQKASRRKKNVFSDDRG